MIQNSIFDAWSLPAFPFPVLLFCLLMHLSDSINPLAFYSKSISLKPRKKIQKHTNKSNLGDASCTSSVQAKPWWFTLLYIEHHLSFLHVLQCGPSLSETSTEECLTHRSWGCAFQTSLQGLPTCVLLVECHPSLWQQQFPKLPTLRAQAAFPPGQCESLEWDWHHIQPGRVYVGTSCGFSSLRGGGPWASKSRIWLCGMRSS